MPHDISPIRQVLSELDDPVVMLEPATMDAAIVGLVSRCGSSPVVCYDREKVIQLLMADGMDEEEAEEYFEFNIEGAYVGESTPMFLTTSQSLTAYL